MPVRLDTSASIFAVKPLVPLRESALFARAADPGRIASVFQPATCNGRNKTLPAKDLYTESGR